MTRIKWIRENPGAPRDEGSYYHSEDGRFDISPYFAGREYPIGYHLDDRVLKTRTIDDSIKTLKGVAERRMEPT